MGKGQFLVLGAGQAEQGGVLIDLLLTDKEVLEVEMVNVNLDEIKIMTVVRS